MKNILVTGGAGFIGCNFVRDLLRSDDFVRVWTLDALTYAGDRENLSNLPAAARHSFVEGDVCDEELVIHLLRDHRIDTIVHFAAESAPGNGHASYIQPIMEEEAYAVPAEAD